MTAIEIKDNSFQRQFETKVNGHLARIEYASHERKVFLTKLEVPDEITEEGFMENFIASVLNHIREKNLKVVPTSTQVKVFLQKNSQYREMLPVGIRISSVKEEPKEV